MSEFFDSDWCAKIEEQIFDLQLRLEENTVSTKNIEKNTKGVVDAFAAAEGAFKVLETIGKLAKPVMWITVAVGGVVTAMTNFKTSIITWFK